ncbi:MAG: hypothetical protein B7O98_05165 [Zestosphaera tikiterensis]|uniref:Type II secretion system protein GspF domain-containing protein n=1 Tax=Zestosphaera tikiterensis TaxID=1973259 RepID=A0A2R7Y639_9CREN|nr:MAG: hypothetical protein B7O98_05165 [Zestosphaera tikiterensis]
MTRKRRESSKHVLKEGNMLWKATRLRLYSTELEPIVIGSKTSSSFEKFLRNAKAFILSFTLLASVITAYHVYTITLSPSLTTAISAVLAIAVFLPMGYALTVWIPALRYRVRRDLLEAKFPLFITLLSLIVVSEKNISKALNTLSTRYGQELKDFDLELSLINSLPKVGIPLDQALDKVASITPSPTLKSVLSSLSTLARVGGDPVEVVNRITAQYLDSYKVSLEKGVNDLGVVLELYLAFSLILPLIVGSIGMLLILYPIRGIAFEALLAILTYLVAPASSIGTLIVTDAIISRLRV